MDKITFKSSVFGYDKNQVISYIKKVKLEHEQDLLKKSDEISVLKSSIQKSNEKIEELQEKLDSIYNDKGKISDVLLEIQQKADMLEQETIKKCEDKKADLDKEIAKRIQDLNDIKADVNALRSDMVNVLEKHKKQLDMLSGFEITNG